MRVTLLCVVMVGMSLSVWQMVVEPSVLMSPAAGTSRLATSSKPAAVASLSGALPAGGRLSSDHQFSDALAGGRLSSDQQFSDALAGAAQIRHRVQWTQTYTSSQPRNRDTKEP